MNLGASAVFRRIPLSKLRALATELRPYLSSVRREIAIAVFASLGAVLMAIARPWPIKMIFDYALLPDERVKWVFPYALIKGYGATGVATISCVLLLGVTLLWGLFVFTQRFMVASAGQAVTFKVRRRLFAHMQRLSLSYHRKRQLGDLLLRATGDANMMRDMLVDTVTVIFSEFLVLIAMIVVMFLLDWRLTLISGAVLPLLAFAVFRISNDLRTAVRVQRKREGRMAARVGEMLQSISVIQVFGREDYEDERFESINRLNFKQGLKTVRMEANLERTSELIIALGTGLVLWFGVQRVIAGWLTPGDLLVFSAYLAAMYRPLRRIARVTGRLSKASACAQRVFEVLHSDDRIRVRKHAAAAPPFHGKVSFKNINFAYKKGQPVLRDVSISAKRGTTVAIVGPNGAGKSTLCSMLPRLYDPDEGSITIDANKITQYTLESVRDQIGVVLQQPLLFAGTIAENIAYGKPEATSEEIIAAARLADADNFVSQLPDTYDTVVGERGDTLSGGQRQKIAIARAMIKQPSILVLDEPTAALDATSAAHLNKTLMRISAGRTTFRVGHRLAELAASDVIVVIEDGRITQSGTHEELLEEDGWYRSVYELQEFGNRTPGPGSQSEPGGAMRQGDE